MPWDPVSTKYTSLSFCTANPVVHYYFSKIAAVSDHFGADIPNIFCVDHFFLEDNFGNGRGLCKKASTAAWVMPSRRRNDKSLRPLRNI